jgi:uncharacterized cupredoxin-like copper-binding protein
MKKTIAWVVVTLIALASVTAACASDTGVQWTFDPNAAEEFAAAHPTPVPTEAASAAPAGGTESGQPAASGAPGGGAMPAGAGTPDQPRVIELHATADLHFTTPDGTVVSDIPVTPGETVQFQVDNVAGFTHDFMIGTDAELSVANATTDTGIAPWESGVQELTWTVPADISGLKFGCTIPGHYTTMQGTFSVAS